MSVMSPDAAKAAPDALLERLGWRYAVKQFDPAKKISPELWRALEQVLILSPSSYGLQPYKFIVVADPAVRKALRTASWGQSQVEDASHFAVFAPRTDMEDKDVSALIDRMAEVRGVPKDALASYGNVILGDLVNGKRRPVAGQWAARQAYIALGNLLTSAALLGVDACPMEGLDPAAYDDILKLKGTGYGAVCACALGYRSASDGYQNAKKVRFAADRLIEKR